MSTIQQFGPLFRLEWSLDTPEDVEIWRSEPDDPDVMVAVVESTQSTFIDTRDDLEAGTTAEWTIKGVSSLDEWVLSIDVSDVSIPPLDDVRRYEAVLLVGSRVYKRKDAPFGTAGGGDLGEIHLRFKDPDVEVLLVGLRRSDSDLSTQAWPTVDALRARVGAGSAVDDAVIQSVLDAAIAVVTRMCKTTAGVGIA